MPGGAARGSICWTGLNLINKHKNKGIMNKVILKGNCGADPKITDFPEGGKVAQFSLATTERGYKTKDGKDIPEHTDWHNIVIKRTGLASVAQQYVKKGTPLLIEGKIQTRDYTDGQGQKRYVTEIVVENMELLGSKQGAGAPAPEPERPYTAKDDEDDMPFGM